MKRQRRDSAFRTRLTGLVSAILILSGCDLLGGLFPAEPVDEPIQPEISVTPSVPATTDPDSHVNITGSVGGDPISFSWTFEEVVTGSSTNGAIDSQIGSGNADGTISIWVDNDFIDGGDAADDQGANDWYLRFTLGGLTLSAEVFNAKDTFAIPSRPYSMITLRKGPAGTEYRHREYNASNLMTGLVTRADYNATSNTLRLEGALRSEWGSDWVQADFSVFLGGGEDRRASGNQTYLELVFE